MAPKIVENIRVGVAIPYNGTPFERVNECAVESGARYASD